ncbi:hypothetical protein QCM80_07660 [Bradyrhizobium sp. SSUT112]|uniref:hypothetical protein n=1 Tax=Bradyrhizobium sp. SSUT112 TaxID=3040604 RepID=UPI002447CC3D|nr:hypothetical protein [Bradyrhizobium sp. SSUT112]MDH2350542.1 hypothetical protein [Bradyrhizobium sp. SSUT112]
MIQKLAINDVVGAAESEPSVVEVYVIVMDGSPATLRMNVFVAQKLLGVLHDATAA